MVKEMDSNVVCIVFFALMMAMLSPTSWPALFFFFFSE
jgi:hypothetical protein